MSKICQSCAMPLKMDPRGGGTEADGSLSTDYCSYCYQNGRFTNGIASGEEMKRYVRAKLEEKGFNRFQIWLYALPVPYLKRWRRK